MRSPDRWTTPLLLASTLALAGAARAHVLCVEMDPTDADVTIHGVDPPLPAPPGTDGLTATNVVATGRVYHPGTGPDDLLFSEQGTDVVHVLPGRVPSFVGVVGPPGSDFEIDMSGSGCTVSAVAVGDVDGDGVPDILVGVTGTFGCGPGEVYVFPGPIPTSGTWTDTAATVVIHGSPTGERLSLNSALAVGDLNGTGPDDIAIGDPYYDRPPYLVGSGLCCQHTDTNAGAVFVVCGTTAWLTPPPGLPRWDLFLLPNAGPIPDASSFTVLGASGAVCVPCPGDLLGTVVGIADVDLDGHPDLITSAPNRQDPPVSDSLATFGQVWVFYGPLAQDCGTDQIIDLQSPPTVPYLVINETSDHPGSYFGASVAADVVPGARTDMIIGAPMSDGLPWLGTARPGAGRTAVFALDYIPSFPTPPSMFGTWSRAEDVTVIGDAANAHLGQSVAAADLNGDGNDDLILGAPGPPNNTGASPGNEAWVLCRVLAGMPPIDLAHAWEDPPAGPGCPVPTLITGSNGGFGEGMAVGDFGGDANADVAIGAPAFDPAAMSGGNGALYAFFGGSQCRFCNSPPSVPQPDGHVVKQCDGTGGDYVQHLSLDGSEDCDPIDNPPLGYLTYHWELLASSEGCTADPLTAFVPNDSASPETDFHFSVDGLDSCHAHCDVRGTVRDCRHGAAPHEGNPQCDPASYADFVVDFADTSAPVLSGCPNDAVASCDAVPAAPAVTATDACDPAPTVTLAEATTPGACADHYFLTRTWTAADRCGNTSTCQQVVSVHDITPPVLTGCPGNVTAQCNAVPGAASPTATDNCDPAPTISFSEARTNGPCQDTYTLTRTWVAKDRCNNTSSCAQTVNVQDTTAPALAGCPSNVTVQCNAVPAAASPTATDNCDPAPTISFGEVRTNGPCQDTYTLTRTWVAKDRCNNTSSCVQAVNVQDTTAPVLAGCPGNVTVQCNAVPAAASPTATDNCDPAPTISFSEARTNGPCQDTYTLTRTWVAKDRCNNTSSCSQTISVQDTVAPVLSGCPGNVTVQCNVVPGPSTPKATDNCDPAPTISFSEVRTNGPCQDTYTLTRTWVAKDRCNNTSSCSQTINVQDTSAPGLIGCPTNMTVQCNAVPAPANPTALDNCDPAPTVSFGEVRTNGPCQDTYTLTRTWVAKDRCNNTSSCSQTLTVRDTTAPVLSGCPGNVTVQCDALPAPGGPTATDNCDPAPTISYAETRVNGSCISNYTLTRTWTARDRCGNTSSCSQTVTVRDTTPPVITADTNVKYCLWPPNHQYVCFDGSDFTPVITDNCSPPITWTFSGCTSDQADNDTGVGDGNTINDCVVTPGSVCARSERDGTIRAGRTYTVLATATDACGNTSAPVAIGAIHVPHDQRDRAERGCISPND